MNKTERGMSPSVGRQVIALIAMLGAVALVAFLGSLATIPHTEDGWYASAEKVAWSPPNWLFAPAWTTLYILMAIAGFLVWKRGFRGSGIVNQSAPVLTVFVLQLILNGLWTPFFFAGYPVLGTLGWWIALIDMVLLILLVVLFIVRARPISGWASLLFVPYLMWLLFASTLNIGVIALN